MKKQLAILLMLLMMLALPVMVFADNGVNAQIQVARENITVGDVIPLHVTVTHPQGWRVVFPKLQEKWGELEIRSVSAPEIVANADGTETTRAEIDVTYFRPGSVTTPELNLTVADAQGQVQNIFVAPVTLEVKSVLAENDQELRDIKPQAELWQLTSSPLPFIGSVALALTIVGGAAFMAWKHRPLPDKRTPRERALDDLNEIGAVNVNDALSVKLHCVRVSDVLREYLDKGCAIPNRDVTTGELAKILEEKAVPSNVAVQIIRVLRVCDDVKFANDSSDAEAIGTLSSVAQQIIVMYPPAPVTTNKNKTLREVTA